MCDDVEVKDFTEDKRTQTYVTLVSLIGRAIVFSVRRGKTAGLLREAWHCDITHGEIEALMVWGDLSERVKGCKPVKRVLCVVALCIDLTSSKA